MANPTSPTLISPIGGVRITDNTPTLAFTIPTDADNDCLCFQVELDTAHPINPSSTDYKKYESRLSQAAWQYWDGAQYRDMPSAGVPSTYYGAEALVTVPNTSRLRNGMWYWQVSASDEMACVKFNQGIFGEKKFCAGL